MKSAFAVHADLTAQAQAIAGGSAPSLPDENGNVSVVTRLNGPQIVILNTRIPCSITDILQDFEIVAGGRSPKNFVEKCEFLAADVPVDPASAGNKLKLKKGVPCVLIAGPGAPELEMMLWIGGMLPGGLLWRFALVDRNYEV